MCYFNLWFRFLIQFFFCDLVQHWILTIQRIPGSTFAFRTGCISFWRQVNDSGKRRTLALKALPSRTTQVNTASRPVDAVTFVMVWPNSTAASVGDAAPHGKSNRSSRHRQLNAARRCQSSGKSNQTSGTVARKQKENLLTWPSSPSLGRFGGSTSASYRIDR